MCFILKLLLGFFTAFGGAAFGAYTAYLFQCKREQKALSEKQYSLLLEAQMILGFHLSSLINLKIHLLDLYKDDTEKAFHIPLYFQRMNKDSINLKSLSFLTNSQDPNLIMELSLADNRYFNVTDTLDHRNTILTNIQASASISECDFSTGKFKGLIDLPQAKLLVDETESLFNLGYRAIDFIEATKKQLENTMSVIFPNRRPVKYENKIPKESKNPKA